MTKVQFSTLIYSYLISSFSLSDGAHLLFVFLSEALSQLPAAPLYAALFFLMLALIINSTLVRYLSFYTSLSLVIFFSNNIFWNSSLYSVIRRGNGNLLTLWSLCWATEEVSRIFIILCLLGFSILYNPSLSSIHVLPSDVVVMSSLFLVLSSLFSPFLSAHR